VAPGADPNDRAIVALASAYGATALLTADAESPVLAPLDLPPVDVLKVSHHGSADPGLPALLERLRPRAALIEVGAHNTYGHPNPATLQQLTTHVPIVRRTDQDGTLRVDLHAGAATVTTGRTPR
jgi:competence protein ComEC